MFVNLEWTKEEIEGIDIKTRKLLCLTGSFHRNSNVDRLYVPRQAGGRGMNSILDIFVVRLIATTIHIENISKKHKYLQEVKRHENQGLLRVIREWLESLGHTINEDEDTKKISRDIRDTLKNNHIERWNSMAQHGFVKTKQREVGDYNDELSNSWLKVPNITSHAEGYIFAIQEQEIKTRALQKSRE